MTLHTSPPLSLMADRSEPATRWAFVGRRRRWRCNAESKVLERSFWAALWPSTSPGPWTGAAKAQRAFAQASRAGARDVGASASAILGDNDGAMIEAMHVTYQDDSKAVETQSELFSSMADAIDECSRIVKDVRLQLDAIDREAHEAIQRIIDYKGGWFGPLAMLSLIWSILTRARAAAEAASVAAVANIGSQAMRVQAATRAHAWRKCESAGSSRLPIVRMEFGQFFMADHDIPKQIPPDSPPHAPVRDDANAPPETGNSRQVPGASPTAQYVMMTSVRCPTIPRTLRMAQLSRGQASSTDGPPTTSPVQPT